MVAETVPAGHRELVEETDLQVLQVLQELVLQELVVRAELAVLQVLQVLLEPVELTVLLVQMELRVQMELLELLE